MNTFGIIMRIAIVLAVLLLIDIYAYQAFKTTFRENNWVRGLYWGISVAILLLVVFSFLNFNRSAGPNLLFQYLMGALILFLVPKLVVIIFMVGEDLWRLISGTVRSFTVPGKTEFLADRRRFISQSALIVAAIPFAGILHGIFLGKYNYRVVKKTLRFKDLPDAFDGLTITHISDIHSGSFDNADKIQYGVDMIKAQKSDIILFTGDLVNNRSEEMEPWIDVFGQLQAPLGKYSVLGNHDYGDYVEWKSPEAKQKNMELLYDIYRRLDFRLLRNENVQIKRGSDTIDLIGVENWGKGFVQYGDLGKATQNLNNDGFKILMSHDPSHFDSVVKKFSKFIHLTLSGHTHGMQFGIEIPGFIKWSPAKFRYPKWAGLYEDLGKYLYVNRGFGFLAFPGRVGIWPEITVIELKKEY